MSQINITMQQVSDTAVRLEHDTFEIVVDRPVEKGGNGAGLMGGEYLLLGIGGCFCSTLFAAAQSRDILIEGLKVQVVAIPATDLPPRFTQVALNISYHSCSHEDQLDKLLKIAEQGCISVNTVKRGMDITVSLDTEHEQVPLDPSSSSQ